MDGLLFNNEQVRFIERQLGVLGIRDRRLLRRAFVFPTATKDIRQTVGGCNGRMATVGDSLIKHALYMFLYDHIRNGPVPYKVIAGEFLSNAKFARIVRLLELDQYVVGIPAEFETDHGLGTVFEALVFVLCRDRPDGHLGFLYRHLFQHVPLYVREHWREAAETARARGQLFRSVPKTVVVTAPPPVNEATVSETVETENGKPIDQSVGPFVTAPAQTSTQLLVQEAQRFGVGPIYGQAHRSKHYPGQFRVTVRLGGTLHGEGFGKTEAEARSNAAQNMLETIKSGVVDSSAIHDNHQALTGASSS